MINAHIAQLVAHFSHNRHPQCATQYTQYSNRSNWIQMIAFYFGFGSVCRHELRQFRRFFILFPIMFATPSDRLIIVHELIIASAATIVCN